MRSEREVFSGNASMVIGSVMVSEGCSLELTRGLWLQTVHMSVSLGAKAKSPVGAMGCAAIGGVCSEPGAREIDLNVRGSDAFIGTYDGAIAIQNSIGFAVVAGIALQASVTARGAVTSGRRLVIVSKGITATVQSSGGAAVMSALSFAGARSSFQIGNGSSVAVLSQQLNATLSTTGDGSPSVLSGIGATSCNGGSTIQLGNGSKMAVASQRLNAVVSNTAHGAPSVLSGVSAGASCMGGSSSTIEIYNGSRVEVSSQQLNATLSTTGFGAPSILSGIGAGSDSPTVGSSSTVRIGNGSHVSVSSLQLNATVSSTGHDAPSVLSGIGAGTSTGGSGSSTIEIYNSSSVAVSSQQLNATVSSAGDGSPSVMSCIGAGTSTGAVTPMSSSTTLQFGNGCHFATISQQLRAVLSTTGFGSPSVLSGIGADSNTGITYVLLSHVAIVAVDVVIFISATRSPVVAFGVVAAPVVSATCEASRCPPTNLLVALLRVNCTASTVSLPAVLAAHVLSRQSLFSTFILFARHVEATCLSGALCLTASSPQSMAATSRLVLCDSHVVSVASSKRPPSFSGELSSLLGPTSSAINPTSANATFEVATIRSALTSDWPCLPSVDSAPKTFEVLWSNLTCNALGSITERPGSVVAAGGTVLLSAGGSTVWNGKTVDALRAQTSDPTAWSGVQFVEP